MSGRTRLATFAVLMALPLALLLPASEATAAERKSEDFPMLHTQGEDYVNACHPSELEALRAVVLDAAADRNPSDAWTLISSLLCGMSDRAEAEVQRHLPAKILFTAMDTGETQPMRELREPGESLLAGRRAWSASAQLSACGLIMLGYMSGEACARSISMRFNGRGWLIVQVDDGCD